MNRLTEFASILADIARRRVAFGDGGVGIVGSMLKMLFFRLTWRMHDLDHVPTSRLSGKFMSARQAANLIPDGCTVVSTGMAGNGRCSIYYWAIRDRFKRTGSPSQLTWVSVGALGGRDKAPGTLEELALPGLISRHIGGHLETHKALLKLADQGKLDLHTISQGVLTRLIEGQAVREYSLKTAVGTGTFIDPRVGTGTRVVPSSSESLVKVSWESLEYRLPPVDVAIFSAPYADAEGNIYFRNASTITENLEAARAARANGGLVLATVCGVIAKAEREISMPSHLVDAIVVNPRNEQTGGVLQRSFFPMFTPGSQTDIKSAYNLVKLANTFTGITPMRDDSDRVMSRQAASILVDETKPGSLINIGVGLPEEVCRRLFESGVYTRFTFTTESGAYGGLPVSGMYFGAALNPEKLLSSAQTFRLYEDELDAAVLGFLQVDSSGNVNVSRRSSHAEDYVGPGGFIDIVTYAKTLIFIGKWMEGATYKIRKGKLVIKKLGEAKFVDKVDEVTFNGKEALRKGKKVYYITNIGVFRLTEEGLALIRMMPGIDVEKDIVRRTRAKIILPGSRPVDLVSEDLLIEKDAASQGS